MDAPVIVRRAAIIVSGDTIGYIEVAETFRDHLYEAGLAAVLSSLLGFGMYFALRTFPLRVLDRTLGALKGVQENLSTQNERLDAALTNMSQGLCMFGADQRLLIFNLRFAEIYGQSPEKIMPGMTMRELTVLAASPGKPASSGLAGALGLQKRMFREGKERIVRREAERWPQHLHFVSTDAEGRLRRDLRGHHRTASRRRQDPAPGAL